MPVVADLLVVLGSLRFGVVGVFLDLVLDKVSQLLDSFRLRFVQIERGVVQKSLLLFFLGLVDLLLVRVHRAAAGWGLGFVRSVFLTAENGLCLFLTAENTRRLVSAVRNTTDRARDEKRESPPWVSAAGEEAPSPLLETK